jgi:hypothetical protein
MIRHIFDGADAQLFRLISAARIEYSNSHCCFLLTLTVGSGIPPNWLDMLGCELMHDADPCSLGFLPEWIELEAPHIRARLRTKHCVASVFEVRHSPLFPIKSVKLWRGNRMLELPNASSRAAFLARPVLASEDSADS